MKPFTLFLLTVMTALVALAGLPLIDTEVLADLPIKASAVRLALLLEPGSQPPSVGVDDKTMQVFTGEVYAHEGDASIQTTDNHFGILGVLAQPKNEPDVPKFLSHPGKAGKMPTPAAVLADAPKSLKSGVP